MTRSAANELLSLRFTEGQTVANSPDGNLTQTATASLTRRLAAGDEEAFRDFHGIYFSRLYRFLLLVCRGREQEAQDALQETLARLVRYARVFEEEEIFWSWLKALARSAAHDGNRKQRRHLDLLHKFALRLELDIPQAGADGETKLRDVLEESLEELSLNDRRLVEGKYLAGETVRELAAGASLSEKAIESRLARLRQGLRERILKKLGNP